MPEYKIKTESDRFFIGSQVMCSYRIQYPEFEAVPTGTNEFYKKICMLLKDYAERRYMMQKEKAAGGGRPAYEDSEIHSLLCDVYINEAYTSCLFTYIYVKGGRCRRCMRFATVSDNVLFLAASTRRLGIRRHALSSCDGFYLREEKIIGFRNPSEEEVYAAYPPSMKRLRALFIESEIKTKKVHINTNNETNYRQ